MQTLQNGNTSTTILIADDDLTFARIMEQMLHRAGYVTEICHSVAQATRQIARQPYDLLLLDYRLPDGTGLDIMQSAHEQGRNYPVIIMTSFDDVRTAVKAMRSGAFDYITKPVNREELLMLLKDALAQSNTSWGKTVAEGAWVRGQSAPSENMYRQLQLVGPTDMSVIIQGESGTGKENIARQIHMLSKRNEAPFIAVDCGTLSNDLAAGELFGHIKGAFTGALHNKKGKFEEADGGTLFLDEIGNLSYEVQIKLLRAIQERSFYALGGSKEIKVNVRIVAATNEDLKDKVSKGNFREDLYHRLNEFKVQVPALRERGDDLFLFVKHFINEANHSLDRQVKEISPEVALIFRQYDWPGNIRELKNMVKRLVLLTDGETAEARYLPEDMLQSGHTTSNTGNDLRRLQERNEKELIEQTLKAVNNNKLKAAQLLNINRSTLYAKLEKYKINV
jgi:two-component system response regulator HydG